MSDALLNVLVDDVTELIREQSCSVSSSINDDQLAKIKASLKSKMKNRFKDKLGARLRRQSSPRDAGPPPQPPRKRQRISSQNADRKRKRSSPISLSQTDLSKRPRPRVASIIRAQKKREQDLKKEQQRKQRQQRQKERRERMEKKRKQKNRKTSREKWTSPEPPKKFKRKGSKEIIRKNSSDTFRKHLSQESARRKRSNSSPREDERHTPTEPFLKPKPRLKSTCGRESIEISDYESEDEDSALTDPRDWEMYPDWARPSNVIIQLNRQENVNPELTFGKITDVVCNIKQIFSTPNADNSRLSKRRTASGDWTKDILGSDEIQKYDEEMGFETLSQQ